MDVRRLALWLLTAVALVSAATPLAGAVSGPQELKVDGGLLAQFRSWAAEHNKPYLADREELARRFKVWASNVDLISRRNRRRAAVAAAANGPPPAFTLGLTEHTDLTREEFRLRFLGAPMAARDRRGEQPSAALQQLQGRLRGLPQAVGQEHWRYENVTPPAAVDWRTASPPILGPIKDQHVNGSPCGSCWAFSAVSIMEIASAKATGKVVSGSEQQLLDCDRKYDHGCEGGGWLNAIQYTISNGGLAEEAAYPYVAKDGRCNTTLEKQPHELRVDGWEDVPFSNETAMTQAVSQTPIIVAICAGPAIDDWHHYAGGVFDAPCCEKKGEVALDHGIVVVGYGEEGGVPFWILKNSWGSAWGEKGFMRIRRNHGKHGKCALATYPAMVFRDPPAAPSA